MRNPIGNSEWLFRRGYATPVKKYMNPDGTPTSRVFKLRPSDNGELSVDVKSLTSPEISIRDKNSYMLFEIIIEEVRSLLLDAEHDPIETNPAHAVIIGMNDDDDITPLELAKRSRRVYID
jgi:hypothetical protein